MQRFHPHVEPWGDYVDVKANAVEVLERQLRRAAPGEVFVSSACDGWQPLERELRLTRECCLRLIDHGFKVSALTKSALILRDLDVFVRGPSRIGVTVTTLDERLASLWEPRASLVEERFHVVEQAHAAGIETTIMFGPLLPFLSDNQESVCALLERAADLHVDHIWVDALNPRPKVWESIAALLDREFPGLRERYASVLFSEPVRTAYLAGVRERVRHATERYRLSGRVSSCV